MTTNAPRERPINITPPPPPPPAPPPAPERGCTITIRGCDVLSDRLKSVIKRVSERVVNNVAKKKT